MSLKGTPFGFGLLWAILSNFEQIENLKNKIIISVFTSPPGELSLVRIKRARSPSPCLSLHHNKLLSR